MPDHQITATDGRAISFADFGAVTDRPVLWCHGGPGSRLEPQMQAAAAGAAGFRLVGIDRPGYGASSPQPGRSIAGWSADALAVADHLGLETFYMVGVSTGGSYALATAAAARGRVRGVVACCALSDMRWGKDNAMLSGSEELWHAPDREAAIRIARRDFGEDGNAMLPDDETAAEMMAPADMELLLDPEFAASFSNNESFAQGVAGYVDDRLADSPTHGWSSFDVTRIHCPVIVVHGGDDRIVPVAHGHHTAEIVPGSELRIFPTHGHLSVIAEVMPALVALARRR